MQKVMLIGNLGRDPDVKYSQQGTAIAQFSVATTERWKDKGGELQEHTEWFAVKTFGRLAEIVGENLHKGARVYLEGRKRTESWERTFKLRLVRVAAEVMELWRRLGDGLALGTDAPLAIERRTIHSRLSVSRGKSR